VCKRKNFRNEAARKAHIGWCVEKKGDVKQYQCAWCKKDFSTAQGLKIHIGQKHSDATTCSECGKTFDSKLGLSVHHTTMHSDRKPKKKACPHCHREYSPQGLVAHIRACSQGKELKKRTSGINKPEVTLANKDFDRKDQIRAALQALAVVYLPDNPYQRAISLPGLRVEEEIRLFKEFDTCLVEVDADMLKKHGDKRVIHGSFVDVLESEGGTAAFSIVDFDLCGRPTYRDGAYLARLGTNRCVQPRFCLRITFCTRSFTGSVAEDVDQLDKDLRQHVDVVSYERVPYRNKGGTTMEVRQWICDKKR
jgi:DNA-directed RNA polymerase subunit RPC12/RpoP